MHAGLWKVCVSVVLDVQDAGWLGRHDVCVAGEGEARRQAGRQAGRLGLVWSVVSEDEGLR